MSVLGSTVYRPDSDRDVPMNGTTIWMIVVALALIIVFFSYYRFRKRSRHCRGRFSRNSSSSNLENIRNISNAYGTATTTYVVRPSGITIAVSTMNPTTPHAAAVAAAEAAEAMYSGQSRRCVKLEGFDAPLDQVGDDCCAICLAPLVEQRVSKGSCSHLIHTACYNSWLAKDVNRACPICRQSVDCSQSSSQSSCDGTNHV